MEAVGSSPAYITALVTVDKLAWQELALARELSPLNKYKLDVPTCRATLRQSPRRRRTACRQWRRWPQTGTRGRSGSPQEWVFHTGASMLHCNHSQSSAWGTEGDGWPGGSTRHGSRAGHRWEYTRDEANLGLWKSELLSPPSGSDRKYTNTAGGIVWTPLAKGCSCLCLHRHY